MILSVEVNLSSAEACKVDSGARGGEARSSLVKELSSLHSLPTPLHYTALDSHFTHSTLKPALVYRLNYTHNTLIYYFVLYLADKAGNTKINTQQLNLLSSKSANRKQSKLDNNKTTHDKR